MGRFPACSLSCSWVQERRFSAVIRRPRLLTTHQLMPFNCSKSCLCCANGKLASLFLSAEVRVRMSTAARHDDEALNRLLSGSNHARKTSPSCGTTHRKLCSSNLNGNGTPPSVAAFISSYLRMGFSVRATALSTPHRPSQLPIRVYSFPIPMPGRLEPRCAVAPIA